MQTRPGGPAALMMKEAGQRNNGHESEQEMCSAIGTLLV